jgi:hypothetical protein
LPPPFATSGNPAGLKPAKNLPNWQVFDVIDEFSLFPAPDRRISDIVPGKTFC